MSYLQVIADGRVDLRGGGKAFENLKQDANQLSGRIVLHRLLAIGLFLVLLRGLPAPS